MKINPDSPDFEGRIESTTPTQQPGKPFLDSLTSKTAPNIPAQALSKQDLTDPAKVNAAVDRAVHDLMQQEFAGICAPDREHVAAWLRNDPLVRAALMQRLGSSSSE